MTAKNLVYALVAAFLVWIADKFAQSLMGEVMRRHYMSAYHWDGTRAGIAALPPDTFRQLDDAKFNVAALVLMASGFALALWGRPTSLAGAVRRGGFLALVAALYWLTTAYSHFTAPTIGHLRWLANLPLIIALVCGGGLLTLTLPASIGRKGGSDE